MVGKIQDPIMKGKLLQGEYNHYGWEDTVSHNER